MKTLKCPINNVNKNIVERTNRSERTMRIDAYNKITQMLQTNNTVRTNKTKGVSAKDHVEISRTGKDYQVAKKALAKAEDIRMDKVNDIKRRIESGTYNVTGEEVANKLVENYFNQII